MANLPFDNANFNLINFANIYPDVMDSTPKTIEYQYKDANGNIQTKSIANRGEFKQQLWDDVGGALGQFNRTFYVDAINGDDNNIGTNSSAPFKTIQKAINSVPYGAFVRVELVSNYVGNFNTYFKKIYLHIPAGITLTIPDGSRNNISGCSITILNEGHLHVETLDSNSNVSGDNYAGFITTNYERDISLGVSTNIYLINIHSTNPITIDNNRCLFGGRTYGTNQNIQMNLSIYNLYCAGNFTLDGDLFHIYNGVCSFQWNNMANDSSFNVVDGSGNAVDFKTKVRGIIKDSNGVPRNITSNIVF